MWQLWHQFYIQDGPDRFQQDYRKTKNIIWFNIVCPSLAAECSTVFIS